MLSIKHVTKSPSTTRTILSPLLFLNPNTTTTTTTTTSAAGAATTTDVYYSTSAFAVKNLKLSESTSAIDAEAVALSFKQWFKLQNHAIYDRVFEILAKQEEVDDAVMSRLGLKLSESLVLEVLNYGKRKGDVLSCLKFFDWVGRQRGFNHTRATFYAIFKILTKAKLMAVMLEYLDNTRRMCVFHRKSQFYSTLVMGYAVAGKPYVALQVFGRMRFQNLDLDTFSYHVLLNALVEEECYDAVKTILRQIEMKGYESEITRSIIVKCLCKRGMLNEAEEYLRRVLKDFGGVGRGYIFSVLLDALCRSEQFSKAGKLIKEFRYMGMVSMEPAYGVWIRDLVRVGKVDTALEFLQEVRSSGEFVPEVMQYNLLLRKLLSERCLKEVCELLMQMMEFGVLPDLVTMNIALSFFCKAGMVDVALELYNSKSEFGYKLNNMAYNSLISSLCADASAEEAYSVLKHAIQKGYTPGSRTFIRLANALCRGGKIDKMQELITVSIERNFMPRSFSYDKFILALCKASRLEEGYLIHGELNRMNKVSSESTYSNLIHGFKQSNRGDIAARLLLEMQDKGHQPTRSLFRTVIGSLFYSENPRLRFFKLLELELSSRKHDRWIYNYFIDGAGHAKKPELARDVFEIMLRNGVEPTLSSEIVMLQSYLKSEKISDALKFFNSVRQRRRICKRLYTNMIVGLANINKVDLSLEFIKEMVREGYAPCRFCYETLVQALCTNKKYNTAVSVISDLASSQRGVTTFIGNVLLLHSMKSEELYNTWFRSPEVPSSTTLLQLGQLIAAFSRNTRLNQEIDDWEEAIKQCFPMDLYTYNTLLRRLILEDVDQGSAMFHRIIQRGYEPNQWTYNFMVHGLMKHGRIAEAKKWAERMYMKGFSPTELS